MQNSSENCTQWYGNDPKMANFGPKTHFLAIRHKKPKRPKRPQMDGKSGSNAISQENSCGGATQDAKFARKNATSGVEMAPKWPI